MAIVGDAFVRIRPTTEGFEADVIRDISKIDVPPLAPKLDSQGVTGPLDLIQKALERFSGDGSNPLVDTLGGITEAAGESEGALSSLSSAAGAIVTGAIATFATASIKAFSDLGQEVLKFQRASGATAEVASGFVAALDDVGISAASGSRAVFVLSKGLDASQKSLEAFGVTVAKDTKGNTDLAATVESIADAYVSLSDPAQRAQLLTTAFGRSGRELIPLMERAGQGIRDLFANAADTGQIFTQDDVQKSEDMRLAIDALGDQVHEFQLESGKTLVPFITGIVSIGTVALEAAEKIGTLVTLGGRLGELGAAIGGDKNDPDSLAGGIRDFFNVIVFGVAEADRMAAQAAAGIAAAGDNVVLTEEEIQAAATAAAAALKEQTDRIVALRKGFVDVTGATMGLRDANEAIVTATEHAAAAHEKLNELLMKGTVDTKQVETARKALTTATDALSRAEERSAAAQDAINAAQDTQVAALDRRAEAEQKVADIVSGRYAIEQLASRGHDLQRADLASRSAALGLTAAQANLQELQASGTATTQDLAEARLAVEEADLRATEAAEAFERTQRELNETQAAGEDGSKVLADAQSQLAEANVTVDKATAGLVAQYKSQLEQQKLVVDAAADQIAATAALNKALLPDPALVAAIKAARDDVVTATDNVADAQQAASEKAVTLGEKQQQLATINHGSIPDLITVRTELEKIVALQPQAAAALQPTFAQILAALGAVYGPVVPLPGGPGGVYGPPVPGRASGGYASGGSFWAGENGRELVDLRPGGGAMVYAANDPASRGGAGSVGDINVHIEASFGPGSDVTAIREAMRGIAEQEIGGTIRAVLSRAQAGSR